MISNVSPASFLGAISTLRSVGSVAPRAEPALTVPTLGASPGSGVSPSANSPRGSLLDINA